MPSAPIVSHRRTDVGHDRRGMLVVVDEDRLVVHDLADVQATNRLERGEHHEGKDRREDDRRERADELHDQQVKTAAQEQTGAGRDIDALPAQRSSRADRTDQLPAFPRYRRRREPRTRSPGRQDGGAQSGQSRGGRRRLLPDPSPAPPRARRRRSLR